MGGAGLGLGPRRPKAEERSFSLGRRGGRRGWGRGGIWWVAAVGNGPRRWRGCETAGGPGVGFLRVLRFSFSAFLSRLSGACLFISSFELGGLVVAGWPQHGVGRNLLGLGRPFLGF